MIAAPRFIDSMAAADHGRHGNARYYAQMLSSQRAGSGDMPAQLGLPDEQFAELMKQYFAGEESQAIDAEPANAVASERVPEWDELCELLNRYRVGNEEPIEWMTTVVATACMGGHHLWQDMGLFSRKDLSALMNENFPELAARNSGDMKWKKFIYKQLCDEEGIYVCRSPSCDVCPDYDHCFGPED